MLSLKVNKLRSHYVLSRREKFNDVDMEGKLLVFPLFRLLNFIAVRAGTRDYITVVVNSLMQFSMETILMLPFLATRFKDTMREIS